MELGVSELICVQWGRAAYASVPADGVARVRDVRSMVLRTVRRFVASILAVRVSVSG